jgi:uncharacterized membrane protein
VWQLRNYFFPQISEINYAILFACTAMIVALNPQTTLEEAKADARVLVIVGASIYLFIRMLFRSRLGHEAKLWSTMLYYYCLLGFLSFFALGSQLDAGIPGHGPFHTLNIVITVAVMILSAIRFLAAAVIFRMDDGQIGKIMTDQFSDHQYKLVEFVVMIAAVVGILLLLRGSYDANETLLLLTFTYATVVYEVVFKRLTPIYARIKRS